ncbi:hypothetical protein MCUN1_003107 [Malassezia cuniculi]|uniref:DH domain-containing protein n=1 Tax=Malassezia cuniculi TaxID=948313 RepID=A0AAF0EXA9_9BASI|nr:hypothetical protein MCUN1_003107 [Malassezia cuniculi]
MPRARAPCPADAAVFRKTSVPGAHKTQSDARLVKALAAALSDPTPIKADWRSSRSRIIAELVESEQRYVGGLRHIHDQFYQPMSSMLPRPTVSRIFGNFADILQVSKELLGRLESRASARPDASELIGDVLLPIVPFFKVYTLFVKNFSAALQCIDDERRRNERFERILLDGEATDDSKVSGLSLQAQLLAVVQRVPRYQMLLGELMKNTPDTHPDYPDVAAAHSAVASTAVQINEALREHEHTLHVLELQRMLNNLPEPLVVPGRRLILHETLLKTCRRAVLPRHVILFSDCVMYARTHEWEEKGERPLSWSGSFEEGPFVFRRKLPLHEITVICYDDVARHANRFDLHTSACSFSLYAPTQDARDKWVRAIREAQAEHFSSLRSLCKTPPVEDKKDAAAAIPRLDDYTAPVWVPDNMSRSEYGAGAITADCVARSFAIATNENVARACTSCFDATFGGQQVASPQYPVLASPQVRPASLSPPPAPSMPGARPILVTVPPERAGIGDGLSYHCHQCLNYTP